MLPPTASPSKIKNSNNHFSCCSCVFQTVPHLQPFSNPVESLCDPVYTEESLTVTSPTSAADRNDCAVREQTVYSKPIICLMAQVQNDKPAEPAETQLQAPSEESTAFLPIEISNPYRSQTSVKEKVTRTAKQSKRDSSKQNEKTSPKTIYVSLNMYKQADAE